jgi:hypothetical protein
MPLTTQPAANAAPAANGARRRNKIGRSTAGSSKLSTTVLPPAPTGATGCIVACTP